MSTPPDSIIELEPYISSIMSPVGCAFTPRDSLEFQCSWPIVDVCFLVAECQIEINLSIVDHICMVNDGTTFVADFLVIVECIAGADRVWVGFDTCQAVGTNANELSHWFDLCSNV